MTQQVCQLSSQEIERLIQHYTSHQVTRQAPGVRFAAKLPHVAITVYQSGKVLFQGKDARSEASKWDHLSISTKKTTQQSPLNTLPADLSTASVMGSDETGTGDYFGPITVAACYIPADQIEVVQTLGVKDSKQLTDAHMMEIAPSLQAAFPHHVSILRNEKYNTVQARGWTQGKMKAVMHNHVLLQALKKLEPERPDYILIDQFAKKEIYYKHLLKEQEIVRENVLFATQAEQIHVAVAAASIIARVAFIQEMERLSQWIGVSLPKGASAKVDQVAARILKKHGEQTMKKIAKWHFANSQKAKQLIERQS